MNLRNTSVSVIGAVTTLYGAIGLGAAAAAILFVAGLGTKFLPGWVGYAAVPCTGIAITLAIKNRTWMGIVYAVAVMMPALMIFGLDIDAAPMELQAHGNAQTMADVIPKLKRMMTILAPVLAFALACMYPIMHGKSISQPRHD